MHKNWSIPVLQALQRHSGGWKPIVEVPVTESPALQTEIARVQEGVKPREPASTDS